MSIALWVLQSLLAIAFVMAGGMKLALPIDQLVEKGMLFAKDAPSWLVRFIGISEVAGALGLILPAALKIQPKLTPIAAALLSLVMVLAVGTHVMRGEMAAIGAPVVLALLCGFIAWGRFSAAPIN